MESPPSTVHSSFCPFWYLNLWHPTSQRRSGLRSEQWYWLIACSSIFSSVGVIGCRCLREFVRSREAEQAEKASGRFRIAFRLSPRVLSIKAQPLRWRSRVAGLLAPDAAAGGRRISPIGCPSHAAGWLTPSSRASVAASSTISVSPK